MSPLLAVESLNKIYHRHQPDEIVAIQDISLQITPR